MKGKLWKRYPAANGKWFEHWCVLGDERFCWYVEESSESWKGSFEIRSRIRIFDLEAALAPGWAIKCRTEQQHGFVVDVEPGGGKNRQLLYFAADGEASRTSWKAALQAAAQRTVAPGCSLRFICVNDVYELDLLANLATCLKDRRTDNCVCVLPGDFIAPSMLSSLDKGRGMIDILNKVGVDYVCFGNHEADIPHEQLIERIKESRFTWVNSNMQKLPLPADMKPLPTFASVVARGGGQERRVAILGLNTEDPLLYTSAVWGGLGAKCIEPLLPTAKKMQADLLNPRGTDKAYDVVVPLTHQVMPLDRSMAQEMSMLPVIIGGHDHDPYYEIVAGTHIVKMGTNAEKIGVIDLEWANKDTPGVTPSVKFASHGAHEFTPDPAIKAAIAKHKEVLDALEKAVLCDIPEGVVLSSKHARKEQTTFGTYALSTLRNALGSDCACINAGPIRGDTEYPADKKTLTYGDLKVQVPYDSEVVVVNLPGKLIAEMVAYSRQFAVQVPPPKKLPGCFLQIDDRMQWDEKTRTVTHINGAPVVPERMYSCALLYYALSGLDNIKPLVEYWAEKGTSVSHEMARPFKEILVDYLSKSMWWHIFKDGVQTFGALDLNNDGMLCIAEFRAALEKVHGSDISSLVVDNVFSLVDHDNSGYIGADEFLRACLYAKTAHGESTTFTQSAFLEFAKDLLGTAYNEASAISFFKKLDDTADGKVCARKIKRHETRRSQLANLMI
eukprot:TRINITY_DN45372_c0_g1_i1.p1 TRINITY_DN45372_c0_g1~~TRINITY_DN45372_c0_g1_i1.p1  ORF type:complete len:728 (-),score=69.40 TRINITY_DN45372_c0_g1_i1:296-2479(-)